MLTIGFTKVYYTLWDVSEPYKHYYGQGGFDWEWRTNYHYLRNLSKDEQKAKDKARYKFGVTSLEPDHDLYGRNSSFFVSGEKGTDRPPPPDWEFPTGIHRAGEGKDIRQMGMGDNQEVNEKEIAALWTLYLKKSIWNNDVDVHSYKNLNPHWVRPCAYARRQLINLKILVRANDGALCSANFVDTYNQRLISKQIEAETQSGHHGENGKRVTLKVREIEQMSFSGFYGTTYLVKMRDEHNKQYVYMGGSPPQVDKQHPTTIIGTISHDEYKGEKQTKLKRVKIVL
jgi:hypothetical protein